MNQMMTTKELSDAGVTRIVMPTCTHRWRFHCHARPENWQWFISVERCMKCGVMRPMRNQQLSDEQRTWFEQWNKAFKP